MNGFTRRNFTFNGAAVLAAAASSGAIPTLAFARQGAGVPAGSPALAPVGSMDPRLAPVDPVLRPTAQMILEMDMPPIDAEHLRQLPADFGPPRVPLLPEIKVEERHTRSLSGGPNVKMFVINSDPLTSRPAILHMHGGGYVLGAAHTELRYLQEFARELDCVVVTVDYRLAPETRFTGSVDDNYTGLKWLYDNARQLGVDTTRIAVMGGSAGGGHAAILAIEARDRGEVPVMFQVLIYPMLDDRTGSSVTVPPHIGTIGWGRAENRFGWQSFLGVEPGSAQVPVRAVPARTPSLAGLPPAWIGVGGVDLFVDEDIEYARRLNAAGVPAELLVIPGAFHAFERIAADTAPAQRFAKSCMNSLRRAFGYQEEI